MENAVDVWDRARRGRHTVVVGIALPEPPQDMRVVRVSCDVPLTTLGPLLEARDRVERILGTSAPLVEMARARVMTGLRRHLLGDLTSVASDGTLVDVFNRFAALGPAVLVLDAAEAADPASLDMLRHILGRPGWLRLPLVITMRAEPREASAAALVDAVRAASGDDAILREAAATSSRPEKAVPPPSAAPSDLRALPSDVLRVLRALAIAGSGCEAAILAAVLETTEMSVLDALQRAADAGVRVEDRGEGRVHLSPGTIEALRASILPSLAAALHRRVAAILAQERPVPAPSNVPPLVPPADDVARPGNAWEVIQAEPPQTMRLPHVEEPPPHTAALPEVVAAPPEAPPAAPPEAPPAAPPEAPPLAVDVEARQAGESDARAVETEAQQAAALDMRAVEAEAPRAAERAAEDERAAVDAEHPVDSGAQRVAEIEARQAAIREAERESARSIEEAIARAALEAEQHAAEEMATRAAEEAATREAQRAADRATEEAARRAAEDAAAHAADQARRAHAARAAEEAAARRAAEDAAADAVEGAQHDLAEEHRRRPAYTKPFAGEARSHARPARWLSPLASEPGAAPRAPHAGDPARKSGPVRIDDDARAARHLAAAGDAEAAIERYIEAMERAAAAAAYPQAVAHAQAALALLERLPASEARRLQRVRILLEAGRVLWHGAGPDDSFTLQGSLRVLSAARASLHAADPAELVADVAVTFAGVLYDIGDVASLSRALDELASASRALAEGGEPRAAARLFNDQAGVYIRLGDPVRAAHLLTESRKIFEPASKTDPIAAVEMAETDHLFARILLHVPARPGREDDALSLGLDHALAAERVFRRIGAPREVGRVLETMGRLELRRGRLERAAERLTAAVHIQESVGDVMGLAQSTAALAEVLAAGGQVREACNLLADSIVLNFEKGSPLGVAENRKTFAALARNAATKSEQAGLLGAVEQRLAAAEKALGRIPIPGAPAPAG